MNDSDLRQLANAAAELLRPHLMRSEALRQAVGLIAQWLAEEARRANTGNPRSPAPGAPSHVPAAKPPPPPVSLPAEPAAEAVAPARTPGAHQPAVPAVRSAPVLPMSHALVPLTLGDAVVHIPLTGTTEELGRARQ